MMFVPFLTLMFESFLTLACLAGGFPREEPQYFNHSPVSPDCIGQFQGSTFSFGLYDGQPADDEFTERARARRRRDKTPTHIRVTIVDAPLSNDAATDLDAERGLAAQSSLQLTTVLGRRHQSRAPPARLYSRHA